MEINISVLETKYIKINVFSGLGDHIFVSLAPEFWRKVAQTCAGGDQYMVSRVQFCSDDWEAASRTDWLPGLRLSGARNKVISHTAGLIDQNFQN